jgi:hypothetical protein
MFTQTQNGQLVGQQSRGLAVGYPDELRLRPTNRELLGSIAGATGGRFDPEPAAAFAPTMRSVPRATPLWPYLVAAAALLFVLDVALRRIDLTILNVRMRRARLLARAS